MIAIPFSNFYLESYDKNKHYSFVRKMARDEAISTFISKRFVDYIDNMPISEENFQANCPYIIMVEGKAIGLLGSTARNKVIELWCAIDKEERGKGYGTDILGKMTIYLIEKFDDIRLVIEKNNLNSQKTALANGYVLDEEESIEDREHNIYYYFGKNYFQEKSGGRSR